MFTCLSVIQSTCVNLHLKTSGLSPLTSWWETLTLKAAKLPGLFGGSSWLKLTEKDKSCKLANLIQKPKWDQVSQALKVARGGA